MNSPGNNFQCNLIVKTQKPLDITENGLLAANLGKSEPLKQFCGVSHVLKLKRNKELPQI